MIRFLFFILFALTLSLTYHILDTLKANHVQHWTIIGLMVVANVMGYIEKAVLTK